MPPTASAILDWAGRSLPPAPNSWPHSPVRLSGDPLEKRQPSHVTMDFGDLDNFLALSVHRLPQPSAWDRALAAAQLASRSHSRPPSTPRPLRSPTPRRCIARWRPLPVAARRARRCTARRHPPRLPHVTGQGSATLPLWSTAKPAPFCLTFQRKRGSVAVPPLRIARVDLPHFADESGANSRRAKPPTAAPAPLLRFRCTLSPSWKQNLRRSLRLSRPAMGGSGRDGRQTGPEPTAVG